MDTRILKHYEQELLYIREMGAEFAATYPKIAARLGMEDLEVTDPYVERLLEGFAFLAARVQLELELQYPVFTSNLLEIVYPHYLCPTPSMMIAELEPNPSLAGSPEGVVFERYTTLRASLEEGSGTPVIFRTSHDLHIWPIDVVEAEYIEGRGALLSIGIGQNVSARAAIRLRLRRFNEEPLNEIAAKSLTFFIKGSEGVNWNLHELLCTQVTGIAARSTNRRSDWTLALPEGRTEARGLEPEESLLPPPRQAFDGYRLLQEYFAMPERFHFVELHGLEPAFAKAEGDEVDIFLLLREGMPSIAKHILPDAFSLNCVPAINLFPKRCDRILLNEKSTEHHVVAERTAPLDFEIHQLTSVAGISGEGKDDTDFRPFYSETDFTAAGEIHPTYYTQHRRMRARSERERLKGVRTSYLGSELYLKLVDRNQAPYASDVEQLAVQATCSNRDLPLLLAKGADNVFQLPDGGPIKTVRTPVRPTRPQSSLAQGDTAWRLISHLSLNYLSIAETDKGGGPAALRELLGLYTPLGDRALEQQLEGIVGVESRSIARRMSDEVLSTAVRGIEVAITFDESFYEGSNVYVLASVLERFFRRQVAINSFSETVLLTQQRGEVARWAPRSGLGRLI